jgi:hypothetical protein
VTRRDAILAILASANGQALTPVQLQKAAFLLDRNIPGLVSEGDGFHFAPYDYGPFDRHVYDEAMALALGGLGSVNPSPWGRWNVYAATEQGIQAGQNVLGALPQHLREYIVSVTAWVRAQSFNSLVKSIYEQYPEMRANSIFQG